MEKTAKGIDTVTGEVLRIEDNDLVVRRFNGKEVRLHLDAHTQMTEMIGRGDRIEAIVDEVNNQGRALSIRQLAK
jgi:ribosomal protein S1